MLKFVLERVTQYNIDFKIHNFNISALKQEEDIAESRDGQLSHHELSE